MVAGKMLTSVSNLDIYHSRYISIGRKSLVIFR